MSVSSYQNTLARLTKEKAALEKQLGQERDKLTKLKKDAGNIRRSFTRSTSESLRQSKESQIIAKDEDAVKVQKKIAEIEAKISTKLDEINRNCRYLENAEKQEQSKKQAYEKAQRDKELNHHKTITRELERQASIHKSLRNSPMIIDVTKLPIKIKVLFFAANPDQTSPLALDEEIRAITQKIRASEHRDSVDLISRWAVRPQDLLQELNEHKPHIVHFSGHGSEEGEIIFLDDNRNPKTVSQEAIVQLIKTTSDNIRVVIFNNCFSSEQAEKVTQHIDVAIGMNDSIGDFAAIIFSAQFYSAIGFGYDVQKSFNQALAALMLEGIPEENTPQIFTGEGMTADEIILVKPPGF